MKSFLLNNLAGHVFSVTPTGAVVVDVVRAKPGTHMERAKSGLMVAVPLDAHQRIEVSAACPLKLFPGDEVLLPADGAATPAAAMLFDSLQVLAELGEAEIVEQPDPESNSEVSAATAAESE